MRITINSPLDGQPVEVFPSLFIYAPPELASYNDTNPIGDILDECILNSPSLAHVCFGWSIASKRVPMSARFLYCRYWDIKNR